MQPFNSHPLSKVWFGPYIGVFCHNPQDAKIIFNSPDFLSKPRLFYRGFADFALLSINGEAYKALRKAITPLLTPKSLKSFLPLIDEKANEFLVSFNQNLSSDTFDVSRDTLYFAMIATAMTFLRVDGIDKAVCEKFLEHLAS
jgi:cytochrome P450